MTTRISLLAAFAGGLTLVQTVAADAGSPPAHGAEVKVAPKPAAPTTGFAPRVLLPRVTERPATPTAPKTLAPHPVESHPIVTRPQTSSLVPLGGPKSSTTVKGAAALDGHSVHRP